MKFVEADEMFVLLHCWNSGELLGSSLLLFARVYLPICQKGEECCDSGGEHHQLMWLKMLDSTYRYKVMSFHTTIILYI